MHSEHILKERSDAQNVVSRFPCGDTTLRQNLRRSRAPFFKLRRSRHHNPRPKGPSNLRTLRPMGPVNPKNLSPCPLSEANTTCRRQAATTLGAQPRQPSRRRRVLYLYSISSRVRASSTVSWPGALASFPAAKVRGAPRRFPATLVRTPVGPMPMVMIGVSGKR